MQNHYLITFCFIAVLITALTFYYEKRSSRKIINKETINYRRNHNREIKLFCQCAVTSIIYSLSSLVSLFYFFGDSGITITVLYHMLWILQHTVNTIVCLVVNSKMRQTLKSFWTKDITPTVFNVSSKFSKRLL